jgi:N utilization substance protein B
MAFNQRRDAREAAVQFLAHCEAHGKCAPAEVTGDDEDGFWHMRSAMRKVRELALELVKGVLLHLVEIDDRVQRHAHHYEIARMNPVDRNVLRLATYEMFFRLEVPPIVAINEAIEIAKRYGTEDSGGFVNGILDHIKEEVKRPLRTAAAPEKDSADATDVAKVGDRPLTVDDLF